MPRQSFSVGSGTCLNRTGMLRVVGIGPGAPKHRTPAALSALSDAEVIVGYAPYIDSIRDILVDQEVIRSGMKGESKRVSSALEMAISGRNVALISSGDAGVYGMAGLAIELAEALQCECPIEVIPGMTAAQAAAAAVGAPLMLDWAVISLSDLMVPWERICQKLSGIASGDLCCVLYNPRSKGRPDLLQRAFDLLKQNRSEFIPVASVREAGCPNEHVLRGTLADFPIDQVDMKSLVIVGDSTTRWSARGMITPRGYVEKYGA